MTADYGRESAVNGIDLTIMSTTVYFDNNATTPLDPAVLEAMTPYFTTHFANPSSAHTPGHMASQAIARARARVAHLVGASAEQVFFCSSATEGINWALSNAKYPIAASEVEHAATLKYVRHARNDEFMTLKVDAHGNLDLDAIETLLCREGPLSVAVMWANNETGVVFPIRELAALCERYASPLHVDAVQAAGKLHMDFAHLPISSMVISAHKVFGPKGAAALIVRDPTELNTWIHGGGQESRRRSGTENVPAIVGFGAACDLARENLDQRQSHVRQLRDMLESGILSHVPKCSINGVSSVRLANTSNIGFEGVDAEAMAGCLDAHGIAVSTGSACHATTIEPSHVIRAMTRSFQKASESIRFSLSHVNTQTEVTKVISAVSEVVAGLR